MEWLIVSDGLANTNNLPRTIHSCDNHQDPCRSKFPTINCASGHHPRHCKLKFEWLASMEENPLQTPRGGVSSEMVKVVLVVLSRHSEAMARFTGLHLRWRLRRQGVFLQYICGGLSKSAGTRELGGVKVLADLASQPESTLRRYDAPEHHTTGPSTPSRAPTR